MSQLIHHHHVLAIAAGVLALILLLAFILLKRGRKQVDTLSELEVSRIDERLATGKFSRRPSGFRRKVVNIQELTQKSAQEKSSSTPTPAEVTPEISSHGEPKEVEATPSSLPETEAVELPEAALLISVEDQGTAAGSVDTVEEEEAPEAGFSYFYTKPATEPPVAVVPPTEAGHDVSSFYQRPQESPRPMHDARMETEQSAFSSILKKPEPAPDPNEPERDFSYIFKKPEIDKNGAGEEEKDFSYMFKKPEPAPNPEDAPERDFSHIFKKPEGAVSKPEPRSGEAGSNSLYPFSRESDGSNKPNS